MSKITVKTVKPAEADNHPTVITDETGATMSGFDSGLKDIQPGDVIDVELKPKGKYLNIVSFKVLEKSAPSHSGGAKQEASPEEIESRYRIAALQCAVSLVAAGKIGDMRETLIHADQYYCWLTDKPAPAVKASGETKPVIKEPLSDKQGAVRPPIPPPSGVTDQAGSKAVPALTPGQHAKAAVPASAEASAGKPVSPSADEDFEKLGGARRTNQEVVAEIYALVKERMKLRGDSGVESWLTNLAKIDTSRLETEPEAVLEEVKAKLRGKA